jgi:Ca2+-dependent lipid-binding protein
MDNRSKSDPYVVVFELKSNKQQMLKGMTEVVQDNLNPVFVSEVSVEFHFEEQQRFLVKVYDADDGTDLNNFDAQDFIGELEINLGKLVSSRN